MDKFSAMIAAQKAVLARFGTSVGPESEAMFKRLYLQYLAQPADAATQRPFYERYSSNALARG